MAADFVCGQHELVPDMKGIASSNRRATLLIRQTMGAVQHILCEIRCVIAGWAGVRICELGFCYSSFGFTS